jgi:hypothetical protein
MLLRLQVSSSALECTPMDIFCQEQRFQSLDILSLSFSQDQQFDAQFGPPFHHEWPWLYRIREVQPIGLDGEYG